MSSLKFPIPKWLTSAVVPIIVCLLFVAALWMLHKELEAHHLSEFFSSLAALKRSSVALAVLLTIASYLILVSYDWLALKFVNKSVPIGTLVPISLASSAISNNFGTLLGGSSIRYRMYSLCGLTATDVMMMSGFISATFWLGITGLAGFTFVFVPLPIPEQLHLPISNTQAIGWVCAAIAISYVLLCFLGKSTIKFASRLPSGPMALSQLAAVAIDLLVAISVLYCLMPESISVGFFPLLAMYLLAILVGVISQVPGGLGVFELVLMWLIHPEHPDELFGSLLAFRAIYYLLPLAFALIGLSVNEVLLHRTKVAKAASSIEEVVSVVLPRVMSVMVFAAGIVLLLSGATPSENGRLKWLRELIPLPVIEISHFLGSVVGVALLLLAIGLRRRVQEAFWMCIGLLIAGVVFSLVKGLDYEEAIILSVMLGLLAISKRHYYRHGAIWASRFTPQWFMGVFIVIAGSVWLTIFSYKQIDYSNELWWQFAIKSDAPRSLRAIAGATLFFVAFGFWRLVKPTAQKPNSVTAEDLADVRRIVSKSQETSANLALLGDKQFIISPDRDGFIMYGTEGRCHIALGDPVGTDKVGRELAWDFRERCDIDDKWPVFYQVSEEKIGLYVDLGLSFMKLGEEARVPLTGFSLEGSSRRNLRRNHKVVTETGLRVEIVKAPITDEVMSDLRRISDGWLAEKKTAEKGFSLGNFSEDYIRNCDVAVATKDNQRVAFTNLWYGADQEEMSLDLMRFDADAPEGTMEYLFVELMLRGAGQGYKWFNLGMAPLSGIETQRLAPLWSQAAGFAFRHGEQFYNFKGLRQYKEKFHPEWRAKYLAYPGGYTLPRVLTNVTTLVSGGIVRTLRK
ncbi:MAG: bifunctional lysylphosphatidylglycerol flippase/synthetase MprF [Pirellulaceae bacterium]|nr:bifunctional lysylphosphatidylglycerol flippase/synthetase MprF [Pirellulaceae bacterium]